MSFNVSIKQSTNTIGKVDDTPFMNVSEYPHLPIKWERLSLTLNDIPYKFKPFHT